MTATHVNGVEVDKLTGERDQWKRRAVDAEKKLRTLRNALGVASG